MSSFSRNSLGSLSYLIDIHLISLMDHELSRGEFAKKKIIYSKY